MGRDRPDGGRQPDSAPLDATEFSVPDEVATPDDLSAMQADDALLDALGGTEQDVADSLDDDELNALLLSWRRDIDSAPIGDLVDTETAVTTIKTASTARAHRGTGAKRRMLVPVAAAAAVLAIAFTGTGLAARDAQPGDMLWGLSKVFYADHARSVQAAASARTDMDTADRAIVDGRFAAAREALQEAASALTRVSTEDNLKQLKAQHQALSRKLNGPEDTPPPDQQLPPESNSSTVSQPSDEPDSSTEPTGPEVPPEQTSPEDPSESSSSTPPTSSSSSKPDDGTQGTSPEFDTQRSNETPNMPVP